MATVTLPPKNPKTDPKPETKPESSPLISRGARARPLFTTHGATFDVRNGQALTAPAYEPTATFPVRIHEGMVQVKDDRWD